MYKALGATVKSILQCPHKQFGQSLVFYNVCSRVSVILTQLYSLHKPVSRPSGLAWPGLAWPIQDPGSRILDPGSWILYPASWIPDPWKSYTILFRNTTGFCNLNARERENASNIIVYHILFYIILYIIFKGGPRNNTKHVQSAW